MDSLSFCSSPMMRIIPPLLDVVLRTAPLGAVPGTAQILSLLLLRVECPFFISSSSVISRLMLSYPLSYMLNEVGSLSLEGSSNVRKNDD